MALVHIELNHFEGYAELSGNEIDLLTKISTKFFGTQERYLGGKLVAVRTDADFDFKMQVSLRPPRIMGAAEYAAAHKAEVEENARIAEGQRVARAELAKRVVDGTATVEALATLMAEQEALYYYERPTVNAVVEATMGDDFVCFYAGAPERRRAITVNLDGSYERES